MARRKTERPIAILPGDVVILETDREVSMEEARALQQYWRAIREKRRRYRSIWSESRWDS